MNIKWCLNLLLLTALTPVLVWGGKAVVAKGTLTIAYPQRAVSLDPHGSAKERPTTGYIALIAENDSLGLKLCFNAKGQTIQVPRDFSAVVLGDPQDPHVKVPNWTFFQIPRCEVGTQAVMLLFNLINAPDRVPQHFNLPCRLIQGITAGPPPEAR